ncbi:Cys-tRNA(Pro) deacylase [Butyrivibrio sp.]|jgi:Cys-tRNA(Pro)/Cys-tRNA(Cys) deacylase|uniref:Cys-tRNA(Pro) deacylase n=1 Tax=Butyrivibrio sp. TaxID=28121 RepID=UPI0025B83625|nr:Cys-tRNA(Pro) deacylase [Butyrivibrio sp.]MBQ9301529.1 Cys-tRNA(Pro) deacylase [Butyrivibrio sp.]
MAKDDKTNVMRVLDGKKISYKSHMYEPDARLSGEEIAGILGEDADKVFKTLVTQGKTGQYYVFVIPVKEELDLKKAAKAVSEKSVSMIPQKELLPLTGYVHGGCSPIGMKKSFPTVIHESASNYEEIFFSAGKVGYQVEVAVKDIEKVVRYTFADVCTE